MNSTSQSAIAEQLERQLGAAERLNDLLAREYDILRQGTPEGLETLLGEKQSALTELADGDGLLRQTLEAAGLKGDANGVEQLMQGLDASGRLTETWNRLAALLRECETRNQTNGSLVDMSRQQVETALNVLRGDTPGTATYGANGQTQRATRTRPIAEA